MNSKLFEKIIIERQRYIDFFQDEITSLRKDKDNFAIELPIQTDDDTIPEPFNIVRVDFITKDQNDDYAISELRLDKVLDYNCINFLYKNVEIVLCPFCWNSCEIRTNRIEISGLKEWLTKWLKVDKELNDEQLSNAIHSCTQPEVVEGMYSLVIDFGTANEAAFEELFLFLNDAGTTKLKIATTEI